MGPLSRRVWATRKGRKTILVEQCGFYEGGEGKLRLKKQEIQASGTRTRSIGSRFNQDEEATWLHSIGGEGWAWGQMFGQQRPEKTTQERGEN